MNWTQDVNPRVWRSPLYVAMAWPNTGGDEGGFIGTIYGRANFPEGHVRGSERWGLTITAALTRAVKEFDPEAVLPEEVK